MPYIPVDQRGGSAGTGSYVPVDKRQPVATPPPEKPGILSRIKTFFTGEQPVAPVEAAPKITGYIPVAQRQPKAEAPLTQEAAPAMKFVDEVDATPSITPTPVVTPPGAVRFDRDISADLTPRAPVLKPQPESVIRAPQPIDPWMQVYSKARDLFLDPTGSVAATEKAAIMNESYYAKHPEERGNLSTLAQIDNYIESQTMPEKALSIAALSSFAVAPIATMKGIGTFMAVDKVLRGATSLLAGRKIDTASDVLPKETPQPIKDLTDALYFIGTGLATSGVIKKAPKVAESLTKQVIETHNLPREVYIEAGKIKDIFQTGTKISAQEADLIRGLGLTGAQYKDAIKNGISIRVPAEKIVTIADKPYWAKLKSIIGLSETPADVRVVGGGKPTIGPRGYLEKGTTPATVPAKPTPIVKPRVTISEKPAPKIETLGTETQVYRGAKDQKVDVTRENGLTGGVSMSLDKGVAERFAKNVGGTVKGFTISPDARVINHSAIEGMKPEEARAFLRDNNVDVVRFDIPEGARGEAELRIINDRVLKEAEAPSPKIETPAVSETSPVSDYLRDRENTTIEKATAKQIGEALKQTRETITDDISKKLGKQAFDDERFFGSMPKEELIAAAARGEFLTDSYMMITKPEVVASTFEKMKEKEIARTTKSLVKQGMAFPEAEKAARESVDQHISEVKGDKKISPPDIKQIVPSSYEKNPAKVEGYYHEQGTLTASLYDGKKRFPVNANLFTYMKRALPDAQVYLAKNERGMNIVVFDEKGKVAGILAPIAGESKFKDKAPIPAKKEPKPKKLGKTPSGASGARGGTNIDDFENRIGEPTKDKAHDLKLYRKVEELIRKYAVRVGEGYTQGNAGLFYHNTQTIRLNGMNNLSVAAHEITHRLDMLNKISSRLMRITGYYDDGKPIYDPETRKLRKEMTDMYERHYPGAKRYHSLNKRMVEGYATLLQKYVEAPITTTQNFPNLVREMLMPGGAYYKPVIGEIIEDLKGIVEDYQALSPLDKVGARVTSDLNPTGKKSFLNAEDYIRTEIADEVFPIEKLAKEAGVGMTKNDPSLWIRQYNNISSIFSNNVIGTKGYWTFNGDGFEKIHDFNWGTLQKQLERKQEFDMFNNWLVARDQHFNYLELERLNEKLKAMRAKKEDTAQVFGEYQDLKEQLATNGFSEDVVRQAYLENKDRFVEEEKMFDALVRADLDFLHSPDVGLITDEEYVNLTSKEGYASLKRQFYDEVIGDESPRGKGISGARPSSLKRRKGSSRTIIAPVFSGIKNHAEILRKGLKQVVYNKIVDVAKKGKHPDLFQQQSLKAVPDPETGAFIYPQDRDPNIIMGRMPGGKRVPVLVDGEIKKIVDELLDFKSIGLFEKLLMSASRYFTKGTTGLYPGFTLTNFTIDQISAVAQTQQGYVPIYSPIKELFKMIQGKNSPEARFFEEYMVMGGERQTIVGWQDMSARELAEKVAKERKGLLKIIDLINSGVDILALPQKYSEIITRAVEYTKSRQAGDSQIVALEKAGRITTPFHHIGRLGGGRFMKTVVKSIPFFNPAIQVLAQAYRSSFKSGGKASMRFFFTALAVSASSIAALSILNATGTKEQKEAYKDLEPGELGKYIWLPSPDGKTLIKVRVPDLLNMPGMLANMAIADQIMDTKYSRGNYMSAGSSFLPTQANIVDYDRAILSWIPQLMKPAVMTAVNKKDFPSVRPMESDAQLRKPAKERFTEATPPVTKAVAQYLNISPIKLDYLLTGYAGRVTGFVTGKKGIYDPLSTFKKESYFESGRRLQDYYDRKKENDQQYTMMKKDPKSMALPERAALLKERRRLENVGDLLERYRKVDENKDPLRAKMLRDKILTELGKL